MKKIISMVSVLVVLSLVSALPAKSECLPVVGKVDPDPVKSVWGMSKCLGKIMGEMKTGEDKTITLELEANQTYWFSASGCVRTKLIFIGVFGKEGVMLKTDVGYQPAFCFTTGESGKYTFLLTLEEIEKGKRSNVSACVTKSKCKE